MASAMAMVCCTSAVLSPLSSASLSTSTSTLTSLWKPALSRRAIGGYERRGGLALQVRAATQKRKRGNVEKPSISTPPVPVGSSPVESGSEHAEAEAEVAASSGQGEGEVEASAATVGAEGGRKEKELTPDEIGQQLRALQGGRGEASAPASGFWSGVWEETKLVEWPQFQKVLGTTGVVVGIIFGSSILLLTVNAVLAELSDQVFNGGSEFAKSWIRGGF